MTKFYGEIKLAVALKSEEELAMIKNLFHQQNITADLTFKLQDNSNHKVDVLEIYKAEWEKFED